MSATSEPLDVIEVACAVLARNIEMLRRRSGAGLDRAEYLILRTLDATGAADICTLAAALGVDPSTAGRQVAAIEAKGLVQRTPAATDRRRSIISPTPSGVAAMRDTRAQRRTETAELLTDWTEPDLRTLADMLTRYNRAVVAKYLTEPQPQAQKPAADALLPH